MAASLSIVLVTRLTAVFLGPPAVGAERGRPAAGRAPERPAKILVHCMHVLRGCLVQLGNGQPRGAVRLIMPYYAVGARVPR